MLSDVNWGILKILFACALISKALLSRSGIFFVSAMFKFTCPGPPMVLRPALPNVPRGGTANAAVLKNSKMVG